MKLSYSVNALALTLILSTLAVGCKHGAKGVTPIPPAQASVIPNPNPGPPVTGGTPPTSNQNLPPVTPGTPTSGERITPGQGGTPLPGLEDIEGRRGNREVFKDYTIHFDFDQSVIKTEDHAKLEAVADYLKKDPKNDLYIEGYCDERGTEEYNRALGERRALAAREYLINLGIGAERIVTKSFGKDRPADPGHDESAWAKNRRDEFVLLLPKL